MSAVSGDLLEVEESRWDELLRRLGVTDAYYSRGYLEASALLAAATPVYLHLAADGGDVVFPALLRSDPPDVVTPYGYGGPLGVGEAPPLAEFAAAYQDWCGRRGALSSFVVYHPLFGTERAAAATGFRRTDLGGTVAWPLDPPDLVAAMHKHHRRVVRRAQGEGLEVSTHSGPRDLGGFIEVYERTMQRTNANSFYFFGAEYWEALAAGVDLVQVDVHHEGELLASVLGMGRPPWLHYHLGGTADAGRQTGASHLALLGLAQYGQASGYELLHLGGGVGGRADSLLEFKQRFAGGELRRSALGKAVHDEAAYSRLTGRPGVDWEGFFPAYREPR